MVVWGGAVLGGDWWSVGWWSGVVQGSGVGDGAGVATGEGLLSPSYNTQSNEEIKNKVQENKYKNI